MTHHLSATVSEDQVLPNQSFLSWLKQQTVLFISQVLASAYFVASLLYYASGLASHHIAEELKEPRTFLPLIDNIHIVFMVIFIITLIRVLDDNDRGEYRVGLVFDRVFGKPQTKSERQRVLKRSKDELRRFKVYFLRFWGSILALYIVFAIKHNFRELVRPLIFFSFDVALNNLSLFFMFGCFLILYLRSDNKRVRDYQNSALWVAGAVLFFLTGLFPVLALHLDANGMQGLAARFGAPSGILNAVVFALLIARLDSKLIGLPSWLTGVLYFYAAVQPFFIIFEQTGDLYENIQASVLIVAFILKIYFFLIVMYILQTGRMLNYLCCYPLLKKKVKPIFKRKPLLKESFGQWLIRLNRLSLLIGVLLAGIAMYTRHRIGPPNFKLDVYFAHLVLLSIFVAYLLTEYRPEWFRFLLVGKSDDSREEEPQSHEIAEIHKQIFGTPSENPQYENLRSASAVHLEHFKRYFLYFWIAMLALYALLILGERAGTWPSNGVGILELPFLRFALNNLGLLALFCCFAVLYSPSHKSGSEKYAEESDKLRKLLVNYAVLAVVVFIASFPLLVFSIGPGFTPDHLWNYSSVFNAVSGTLNAVVLALLIARLNSTLLGLNSCLIFLLYLYSAIQTFFVLFDLHSELFQDMLAWVLIVVLGIKVFFFLIISYALETGRIRNYFFCLPFLNTRVNSVFDNQFEIKTHREGEHSFKFSITRKGFLVYFTDTSFSTREECDRKIDRLRNLMEKSGRYQPREKCGTHWIDVTDSNDDILCQSTSLRSENEVAELAEESIEKIPYCKYDRG